MLRQQDEHATFPAVLGGPPLGKPFNDFDVEAERQAQNRYERPAALLTESGPDGLRYVAEEEMERFVYLRRQEIVRAARLALGERSLGMADEECRKLFLTEMPDQYLSA